MFVVKWDRVLIKRASHIICLYTRITQDEKGCVHRKRANPSPHIVSTHSNSSFFHDETRKRTTRNRKTSEMNETSGRGRRNERETNWKKEQSNAMHREKLRRAKMKKSEWKIGKVDRPGMILLFHYPTSR